MKSLDVIYFIITGGLLGAIGQVIRMLVGLKKLRDDQTKPQALEGAPVEQFSTNRLVLSLVIGFVAGAVALLVKHPSGDYTTEFIFTVIATGYSGTDFIEGVFNTYLAKVQVPSPQLAPALPTPQPSVAKNLDINVSDEAKLKPAIVNG